MNILTEPKFKGDSISLGMTSSIAITGFEIRAEFFDGSSNSIKLATSNVTGGSDDQIEITSSTEFTIKVAPDLTTNFKNDSSLEIELKNASGTYQETKRFDFKFQSQKITWTNVT